MVKIEDACFVMPLSSIEECVELNQQDIANAHGRNLAHLRGETIPYVRLREQFGIKGTSPPIQQIVITRVEGFRVGFVVDQVIGEYQTVIKKLGSFYNGIDEVSGATILGDGTVALILDVTKLVQKAEALERGRNSRSIH
jgi:two-component system chemotaxis sensor kinase CheA